MTLGHKQRRTRRHRHLVHSASVASASTDQLAGAIPLRRRWLWRLSLALLAPALFLGCAELVLRLAGYGYPADYFKKHVIADKDCFVDNEQFSRSFFPPALARIPAPIVIPAHKTAGKFRIFIFGESAAEGIPRPQFGAARYLEVLLRERFAGTQFEVVNTAVTAINSHVILPIARECSQHAGDFWIIYMGNNEMIGPFGAATAFGQRAPPLAVIRLGLSVQRTRLGQLLMGFARRITTPQATAAYWQGMEMFVQNRIPPNDPRKKIVYDNFRKNLQDILRAGSQSGAKVILNTVAVNLKDCPPFASSIETNLSVSDRSRAEDYLARARAAAESDAWTEAQRNYRLAAQINPHSAELQFGLGECSLHLTNSTAAQEYFQAARDDDELVFRADTTINSLIRSAAQHFDHQNVTLCDSEVEFTHSNPVDIPGRELFYEHVHLNSSGNYRLAMLWAEKVRLLLPRDVAERGAAGWSSQETCERLLGLTDWNRVSIIADMVDFLRRPPFTAQPNNARRLAELRAEADQLHRRIAATPPAQAREIYDYALHRSPRDYQLHENFAEFLEATGNLQEATTERQTVCNLIPHRYFPYYSLGTLLKDQGRIDEARNALLRAAELNPNQPQIYLELGLLLARQAQWREAWTQLGHAQRLNPQDPQILFYAAEVLWKLERRPEAILNLRQALQLKPDYWEAHYRLGDYLSLQGEIPKAVAELQQALRLQPDYARAHLSLAVALLKLNRHDEAAHEFRETLRLDPQNRQALEFMAQHSGSPAP